MRTPQHAGHVLHYRRSVTSRPDKAVALPTVARRRARFGRLATGFLRRGLAIDASHVVAVVVALSG